MSVRNHFIQTEAVDAKWFLALKAIRRPLVLRSLALDSLSMVREKEKAFADSSYNPTFSYVHLDGMQIRDAYDQLLQLREQVCQKEMNSSIRTLYTERLTELILEQELLLATAEERWDSFIECNQLLYGDMSQIFIAEHLATLQTRYSMFESFHLGSFAAASTPSQSDFESMKIALAGPDIVTVPNILYTSDSVAEAWNAELGRVMPDWKVVIDSTVAQMLVDHRHRTVRIPVGIRTTAKRMRKLFVHEIGTHVYRREQGKQNRLQLASIGLAGYQPAEEGLAMMRAQLVSNRFYHFGGLDKYLVLALATGHLDGVPKNFSQTFQLLIQYYTARLSRVGKNHLIETVVKNRAWNSTVRIFRGGNPALPGSCFMRDKLYHEGNRVMWDLGMNTPELLVGIFAAKFDPTNELQRAAVQEFTLIQ